MKELWRSIPGYEGYYQVSNKGRVKSLERIVDSRPGVKQKLKEQIRKVYIGGNGYVRYNLSKDSVIKTERAHRLVAEAFIPNPDMLPCINHKDGNPSNNNVDNLEWCTYSQNTQHAYKTGLMADQLNVGEKNGRSILDTETVLTIRESYKHSVGYMTHFYKDMAEVFNTSTTTILRIIKRTHWKIEAGQMSAK